MLLRRSLPRLCAAASSKPQLAQQQQQQAQQQDQKQTDPDLFADVHRTDANGNVIMHPLAKLQLGRTTMSRMRRLLGYFGRAFIVWGLAHMYYTRSYATAHPHTLTFTLPMLSSQDPHGRRRRISLQAHSAGAGRQTDCLVLPPPGQETWLHDKLHVPDEAADGHGAGERRTPHGTHLVASLPPPPFLQRSPPHPTPCHPHRTSPAM